MGSISEHSGAGRLGGQNRPGIGVKKGLETVKYSLFGVAMAPFGLGSGPTGAK